MVPLTECPEFRSPLHIVAVWIKLNDQKQVFRLLYAIWPNSKDLSPTYLKATQPPSISGKHQVTIKLARLATRKARLAYINGSSPIPVCTVV